MSKVSVIIPVKIITPELREAVFHLNKLQPPAHEVLVFVDEVGQEALPGVKLIATGPITPPQKRDLALKYASGDIFAFLDDDAYPKTNWLEAALSHFSDPSVAAVAGPALTALTDKWQAQVSGGTLTAWLGSGPAQMRYWPVKKTRDVDDWPSVNLFVRRSDFAAIGGFGTTVWPGDDTKLCLEIIRKKLRIVYEPATQVYHHRASTLNKHLRQVARYGIHRGHFARVYPETSLRLTYFLPSLLLLAGIVGCVAIFVFPVTKPFFLTVFSVVFLALLLSGVREAFRVDKPYLMVFVPPMIFLTHAVYAVAFIRGLLSPRLKKYQRTER